MHDPSDFQRRVGAVGEIRAAELHRVDFAAPDPRSELPANSRVASEIIRRAFQ